MNFYHLLRRHLSTNDSIRVMNWNIKKVVMGTLQIIELFNKWNDLGMT